MDFDAAAPGAYYASLLGEAERDGRIGRVPYDPALRVDTAWDLGIDDYTAIWFFQQAGREVRVVDYFETSGRGAGGHRAHGDRQQAVRVGTHHLPHDVMVRELATAGARGTRPWARWASAGSRWGRRSTPRSGSMRCA